MKMDIGTVNKIIRNKRRENRPWNIALGLVFGAAAICTDFYLPFAMRAVVQETIWSLCSVGFLFISIRGVLKRRKLLVSFLLTLIVQFLLVYLARPLFPLSNSLM